MSNMFPSQRIGPAVSGAFATFFINIYRAMKAEGRLPGQPNYNPAIWEDSPEAEAAAEHKARSARAKAAAAKRKPKPKGKATAKASAPKRKPAPRRRRAA